VTFAALQAVDAMQTVQIISPWQTVPQPEGGHSSRKFTGGEGNPLLRWWMDPEGMEPFVLGPHDEAPTEPPGTEAAAAWQWDPERADNIWRVRTQRIASFKAAHTLAICGAARLLGATVSPSWEIAMLGVANAISLANVGRNHWCGLPISGPSSHAMWEADQQRQQRQQGRQQQQQQQRQQRRQQQQQ
jgi:hypothetical protein